MTALLTAAAGALGVLALFEALTAIDGPRALGVIERVLVTPRSAGRDGRPPGPADRRRLALTAAAVLCAVGWLVAGGPGAVLCAVAGPPGALALVAVRRRRWRAAVAGDAGPAARALAAALASGNGLGRSLALAARDGALGRRGRDLLGSAVAAIELGAPTEAVLQALARRAGPGPWPALVAALLVQRETGGDLQRLLEDLADDLDTVAHTAADARAASAQARLTARIVIALPLLGAALIEAGAPGALGAVLGDPAARLLVLTAAALELLALAAVVRIARVGEG